MITNLVDGRKEEIRGDNYRSLIHLSPLNKRIVVKDYKGDNLTGLVSQLTSIAEKNDFTKIWTKVEQEDKDRFADLGFETEALIKGYYSGTNAFSMAYYLSADRKKIVNPKQEEKIIDNLASLKREKDKVDLPQNYHFKLAEKEDLSKLADLYDQVFDSYPYPINQVDYLEKMWAEDVIYGLVYNGDDLVAAAAAETVPQYKNVEMTDFATLEDYRGQGLASYVLKQLEEVLKRKDYHCLYTIARARVMGINKIFSQAGYQYAGRLIQNCNIAGGLEDMNLWSKTIN